jgi:hypothetical protein
LIWQGDFIMRKLLILLFVPSAAVADMENEVHDWYLSEFAPQFASAESPNAQALKQLCIDNHILH